MTIPIPPETLESSLAHDNPLRTFPYWGGDSNLQVDSAIEWAIAFLLKMEGELPCIENRSSIWHLEQALDYQINRRNARRKQGVIGTKSPHQYEEPRALEDIG